MDTKGGRGQLIARHPDTWTLWFQSAMGTVHEEWAMMPTGIDAVEGWGRAIGGPHVAASAGAFVPAPAVASQRGRRTDRTGDRRREDRRHADYREAARSYDERRQGERRRHDRREPRSAGAPA
jgi:hypothetical protein